MKEWFLGLGSREQMMVGAGAGMLVLLLIYALVWAPLAGGYDTMKTRVSAQRDTAAWVDGGAQTLQQLKRRGPAARGLGGKSLLAMADSTARSNGLGPSLKRVEPEGSRNVRVWLEDASFDLVVKWLATLSTSYGIETDTATMERIPDVAGKINARLTLQAPGT
ncbi:MAG: type II secretion system protein M [Halobacteria archaeon]|nr:type II secretion system protein M [Halobacteria archaeon]